MFYPEVETDARFCNVLQTRQDEFYSPIVEFPMRLGQCAATSVPDSRRLY